MLRAMILVLTLLLVTLSAAYLGQDEQLTQVLRMDKTPVTSLPVEPLPPDADSEPPPESAAKAQSQSQSAASQSSSTSPRFVMDEPLTNPIPPAQGSDPGPSETSGELPPDPSAHALLYPVEDESAESYVSKPPTEEEKLAAAEPYVKELFALKDRNVRAFGELADQALSEYLGIAPDKRADALPALMDKYLPRAADLAQQSDLESEAILLRMSAALAAIGADDSIVQDARAAYERSKEEQMAHYTELFSSLPAAQ